jgi:hypothetical protein
MMWNARQRPFYSVGGEPEDGDGDDAGGDRDDVGVCVPRHGPATDCRAMPVVAFFFTTRSSGDGDEPIILIYARPRATSRIGQWPGVDLALVMAVTTLILG